MNLFAITGHRPVLRIVATGAWLYSRPGLFKPLVGAVEPLAELVNLPFPEVLDLGVDGVAARP